jgi:hypothetical protein
MFGTRAFFAVLALLCLIPMNSQTQSPSKGWRSADPGAVGLDAAVLAGFDADIAAGKYGYVDSMLVGDTRARTRCRVYRLEHRAWSTHDDSACGDRSRAGRSSEVAE